MKTIIDTATKISIHLLEDEDTRSFAELGVPQAASMVEGVSIPDNYYGYKYRYIDSNWVEDSTFVDPEHALEN